MERKRDTVGGERSSALEVLRRRKCQLDSALTISGTGGAEGWNRRSGECPRPTLTWAFSRRQSVLMVYREHDLLATARSGEGGGQERGEERKRGAGETGNGHGTATVEGGESGGGKGTKGRGIEKGDRWWGARTRTRGSTKEEVPIKFGT